MAALPFLATAALARLGYLNAVAAALAAEALPLPTFAQALAAKLLDPPAHGWRRSSRDDDTVAAVAGLAAPLPGEAMLALARGARSFSAGVDGVVAAVLLEERARDVPMIVLQSAQASSRRSTRPGCSSSPSAPPPWTRSRPRERRHGRPTQRYAGRSQRRACGSRDGCGRTTASARRRSSPRSLRAPPCRRRRTRPSSGR